MLFSYGDLVVAVPAVNRSAACGIEGYFGILAALGADHRIHLAWCHLAVPSVAAASITLLLFSCLTAGGTALGLVGVTLGGEEFLLFNGEAKRGAAIEANDGFLLETHLDDLLFNIW